MKDRGNSESALQYRAFPAGKGSSVSVAQECTMLRGPCDSANDIIELLHASFLDAEAWKAGGGALSRVVMGRPLIV